MYAHTAADALSVVGRFRHIHIHLAGFGAFSTGDALVFIHLNLEEGHPVEQRIECTQWAEPLAKWAVKHHTGNNDRQQDTELPAEQLAERGAKKHQQK